MIDASEYSLKFPMTAELEQQTDNRWGWVVKRGKKVICRHGVTCKTRAEADKNMRRTLFAIRHDDKPVQIKDYKEK